MRATEALALFNRQIKNEKSRLVFGLEKNGRLGMV